jgi:hypothetical protein
LVALYVAGAPFAALAVAGRQNVFHELVDSRGERAGDLGRREVAHGAPPLPSAAAIAADQLRTIARRSPVLIGNSMIWLKIGSPWHRAADCLRIAAVA